MTFMPPPLEPAPQEFVAPVGPVDRDVPCRKCGYNLRSLSPNGRCPECGTAVGYSLQGDFLRFMNPDWVQSLATGARMIVLSVLLLIVAVVMAIAVGLLTRSPQAVALLSVIGLAGWILMFVGWWRLTQPDPSGLGEDQYGTSRKLIRTSLLVTLAAQVVQLAGEMPRVPTVVAQVIAVLTVGAAVFGAVGLFAELAYLEKLAMRIPDAALSSRAHFLFYALGITYSLTLAFTLFHQLSGGARNAALSCILLPVLIGTLVFGVMFLLMLGRISRQIREQADLARATWAAPEPTVAPG